MIKKYRVVSVFGLMLIVTGCELKLCEEGSTVCNSVYDDKDVANAPLSCQIERCVDHNWDNVKVCLFGADGDGDHLGCIDPCRICGESGQEDCPVMIQGKDDKGNSKLYRCSQTGWTEDVSCNNDFRIKEKYLIDTQKIFEYTQLNQQKIQLSDNIVSSGACGECSSDTSPLTYVLENGKCISHQCDNGMYQTKDVANDPFCIENNNIKNCTAFIDQYKSQNQIFVNIKDNRYHCGECGHVCGVGQKCIDGACSDDFVCDNGYTTIQLGSRWIKAKCIATLDEIDKDDGDKHEDENEEANLDNAYILVSNGNIEIGPDWTFKKTFSGYLFGNNKTIQINGFKNDESVGLFKELDNAYISDLNIEYRGKSELSAKYFGLLAGKANDTVISNIKYSNEDHPLKINDTVAAGGLIGKATNIRLSDIQFDVDLTGRDDCSETDEKHKCLVNGNNDGNDKKEDEDGPGVGGLIGVAVDIDSISNVYPLTDNNPSKIIGYRNAGGLIGSIIQESRKGEIINHQETPFDVEITGFLQNIGGLFGIIACPGNDSHNGLTIENVNLNEMNLIFGGEKDNELEHDFVTSPDKITKYKLRNFGGYLGAYGFNQSSASDNKLVISNVSMRSIEYDDKESSCKWDDENNERCSARLGGFVGFVNGAFFDNIKINGFKITKKNGENQEFRSLFGGFAGYSENSKFENCSISEVAFDLFEISTSVGGFIGTSTNNQLNHCNINRCSIKGNGKWIGETGCMIGHSMGYDVIRDSSVNGGSIEGRENIGGLVGLAENAQIDSCKVKQIDYDTLVGTNQVGGLVGKAVDSSIVSSTSDVNLVKGLTNVGGFAGEISNTNISHSHSVYKSVGVDKEIIPSNIGNSMDVITRHGGFVGYSHDNSSITDSFAKGEEIIAASRVGGFVGHANNTKISYCDSKYNKLDMVNNSAIQALDDTSLIFSRAGGFAGYCAYSEIKNCYAVGGDIMSVSSDGGFIGVLSTGSKIINSYSVAKIIASSTIGGFLGYSNSNNDIQTCAAYTNISAAIGSGNVAEGNYIGGFIGNIGSQNNITASYTSVVASISNYKTCVDGYIGCQFDNASIALDNNNYAFYQSIGGTAGFPKKYSDFVEFNPLLYTEEGDLQNLSNVFEQCTECQCSYGEQSAVFERGKKSYRVIDNICYEYNKELNVCRMYNMQSSINPICDASTFDEILKMNTVECVETCHDKYHLVKCDMKVFKEALNCESGCSDLIAKLCPSNTENCSKFWLPLPETDVEPKCNAGNEIVCSPSSKAWCESGTAKCQKVSDDPNAGAIPVCVENVNGEGVTPKCVLMPPFCGG